MLYISGWPLFDHIKDRQYVALLRLIIQTGNIILLTFTLCGVLDGADGRSGGRRSERSIQEVRTRTLLLLPTLVLVKPLVEDLDHSILF